jgi:predicted nucleic acid-binding protein
MRAVLVLVDSGIWIPFFNRPQSPEKRAVDELLDDDRAVIIGPVFAEILQGFRRDAQADWAASRLRGVREIVLQRDDWREAARIGRRLAAQGHRLPLSDLALAAVALRHDCAIYATDPHFDLLPELNRFTPI